MNEYEAVKLTFPGCSEKEVFELIHSYDYQTPRGRRNSFEHSLFLRDCIWDLESKGYQFGCGAKDGCTPGCTC